MATQHVDQVYRYQGDSSVVSRLGRSAVLLSSSGGVQDLEAQAHPYFFDGSLHSAEQMATALLLVARVARTRFYMAPGMVAAVLRAADPVVTSNGDRLRFESFSVCCGVHVRLDVLPEALDAPAIGTGTTNVDVNPPMRQALAGIGGLDPLHLSVGEDVTVTTRSATVTEHRVPLPGRWLKGFAEVQVAGAGMRQVFDLPAVAARRFIADLPATSSRSTPLWAVPAARGVRLTSRLSRPGVRLAGPERLRVLAPLSRFATGLRAYAPVDAADDLPAASVWELHLEGARVSLTLSPEVSRGFSGEGGVLRDLADPLSAPDADLVAALLSYEPRIDIGHLARGSALPADRVRRALGRLGAAGRVGFDLHEQSWFHRELPYDPALLTAMHPRLRDARRLVDDGAFQLEGDTASVTSKDVWHELRRDESGWRCSCPWYRTHRSGRGPCKHILAVEELERG